MKILIASDIHGSAYYCKKLIEAFENEKAERLMLLGDILYHGPRNDLPRDYAPKEVIAMLSELKDKIFCVRGNCDTEVDQMVLPFPILADYCVMPIGEHILYATHGHNYNPEKLPPLQKGDILINGHTHIPVCEERNGIVFMNCGSVSIPKENSPHSYITFENGTFNWKNLENGETFELYKI